MGDVLKPPKRDQLAAFLKTDQQGILAFEQLFKVSGNLPGTIFFSGCPVPTSRGIPAVGGTASRALYPTIFSAYSPVSAVTISHASPGLVAWIGNGNGLAANTPIYFTGAVPSPLVAGTEYFVKTPGDNFTVSATAGGAAINTAAAGTGTATAYVFGIGDGSTTFGLPNVAALVAGVNAYVAV